jgi:hypothetical protein
VREINRQVANGDVAAVIHGDGGHQAVEEQERILALNNQI